MNSKFISPVRRRNTVAILEGNISTKGKHHLCLWWVLEVLDLYSLKVRWSSEVVQWSSEVVRWSSEVVRLCPQWISVLQ